jgi:hypothetical protein
MENPLAKFQDQNNSALVTQEFFDDLAKRGEYIPPISLFQKMSEAPDGVNIKYGEFLFNQKENWGKSFDAVPIVYRPHAMLIENKKVVKQTYKQDKIFEEIKAMKDAGVNGALPGIDFLCWIPSKKIFAIYFLYKTALKGAGQDFRANVGKFVTIQSKHVEHKGNAWETPEVIPSTNSYEPPLEDDLNKALEMFKDIDTSEVENNASRPR